MKKEFSVIELAQVVKELQGIVGGRINKVLQYSDKVLAFECFKTGKGRVFLNIYRPGLLWLGASKFPSMETGFYKNLAKQIDGGRIVSITQIGSERIVKIDIKVADKIVLLYIELFNKGQVVLCNADHKIMALWETQLWKDRELKAGGTYVFPQKMTNIFTLSEEEFQQMLTIIDESVSKTLATELCIGGVYAQELCVISGIDKNKKKLTLEEIRVLFANLQFLVQRKIESCVVYENNLVKDIVPFPLKAHAASKQVSFPSYNAALDAVMSKNMQQEVETKSLSQFEVKKRKLANIIEVQKLYHVALEKQVQDEQCKGEIIYEQYQKIKEVLDRVVNAAEKTSFKDIKQKAKELGIVDFDDVTGEMSIDV